MKNVIYFLSLAIAIISFSACDDDNVTIEYPRLFTYIGYEITDYQEFVLGSDNDLIEISSTRESDFTNVINSFFQNSEVFIDEFELLDEERVRVKFNLEDNQVFDSTFVYRIDGEYVDISGLDEFGPKYILYNDTDDIMYARNQAYGALPGPNYISPDPNLYAFVNVRPSNFDNIQDHANDLINVNQYEEGDTLMIAIPRRIYQ